MVLILTILTIILCCLIIWKASDGFEVASEFLGRNLNDGVRGATINAIGSSMPELFTTLFFLFMMHDTGGFSGGIGTTAGSAIFNSMVIPACVILVVLFKMPKQAIRVQPKVILRDGIALILCEFVLIYLISGTTLAWWHGAILMSLYIIYVLYMLGSMSKNEKGAAEEYEYEVRSDKRNWKSLLSLDIELLILNGKTLTARGAWFLLLVSMFIIGGACASLVYACELMGQELGIPVYFIAVILASAATSVPDTILSMKDAQKGNYDDAVSNAIGSNIFDICFALGFPLFLYTILFGEITMGAEIVTHITELRIILLILTFVVFLVFIIGKTMGRLKAYILIGLYVVFTLYVLGRATDHSAAQFVADFVHQIAAFLRTN